MIGKNLHMVKLGRVGLWALTLCGAAAMTHCSVDTKGLVFDDDEYDKLKASGGNGGGGNGGNGGKGGTGGKGGSSSGGSSSGGSGGADGGTGGSSGGTGGTGGTTSAGGSGGVPNVGGMGGEGGAPIEEECGNGVPETGEECDEGDNNSDTGDCTESCKEAFCGDGLVHADDEACDTAGESAECNADCSAAECGDGIHNQSAGEECDAGRVQTDACERDCTLPTCGDGVLNTLAGEECDDGAKEPWDGCSPECQLEWLTIAVENDGDCAVDDTGAVGDSASLSRIIELLNERGHDATLVTGADLDSLEKLQSFDVVVLGGYTAACVATDGSGELALFDANVSEYVNGGGGLFGAGWVLYASYLNVAPQIEAMLPFGRSMDYFSSPTPVVTTGSHPIVTGVGPFEATRFLPYGTGPKAGVTVLIQSQAESTAVGGAWEQGSGRAVFLGPLYTESYPIYDTEPLTDGTQPDAIELLMRAIEWSGGWYE